MKKIILASTALAFVLIVLLCSCAPAITPYYPEETYSYREETRENKPWDRPGISIGPDAAPTKEHAIAVANKRMEEKSFSEYWLGGVVYETEDRVWIVWYTLHDPKPVDGTLTVGACYDIAVSRATGRIIAEWPEE